MSSPLAVARSRKGFSQAELADESGVSLKTIKRLEADPYRGAHSMTLARLASALDIGLDDLVVHGDDGSADSAESHDPAVEAAR